MTSLPTARSAQADQTVEEPVQGLLRRTTRAGVKEAIKDMLNAGLPAKYTEELFEQKCGALFQHILKKYPQRDAGVYAEDVA